MQPTGPAAASAAAAAATGDIDRDDSSLQLEVQVKGVPPEAVLAHIADPQNLLGLQPLLVAVEKVRHSRREREAEEAPAVGGGAAAGSSAAPAAAGGLPPPAAGDLPAVAAGSADGAAGLGSTAAEEVQYEAVEAFHFLWGALTWHNRIQVRQQLLGCCQPQQAQQEQWGQRQKQEQPAAEVPSKSSSSGKGQLSDAPWLMRYLVVSPPLGMVRLEVLWTLSALQQQQQAGQEVGQGGLEHAAATAATAAAGPGRDSSGGTLVQLDVQIQAPWLLRGFVVSQAQQAQQRLLANLKQRLEQHGA